MANKVKQFRYYGEQKINNYPDGISKQSLISGDIFNQVLPVTQIGIQTLPGTRFYLNASESPILIGVTGIYELDLDQIEITKIRFDQESLDLINSNDSAYLLIDVLYKGE